MPKWSEPQAPTGTPAGLIDTHCHLDAAEFEADRGAVLQRARDAGVAQIIIPAVNRRSFAAVARLCAAEATCKPAYGIHPMYVDQAAEEDLAALEGALDQGAIAVGEIGLDFFVPDRNEDRQRLFFQAQLAMARRRQLPVLLHVRRAVDAVLGELRRCPVPGGIAHAFNGSRQQADAFIALGFKLGFGGAMTYERATRLRELAATLPLESIVLETDAPDIPPAWLDPAAPRRNEPAELPAIANVLAALRGVGADAIAAATTANARAVLPGLLH